MPMGIQAFDQNGNLIFDTTDRIGRVVGVVFTNGGSSGNYSNADLSTGAPFALFNSLDGRGAAITHSFSGNTFSWAHTSAWLVDGYFILGVY